ncbi:hypothetical protein EAO68_38050 [Streptomyces sp. wa22]|nr:hypothetical protein EAO68_38050 [Streptomyces sp. wa22]
MSGSESRRPTLVATAGQPHEELIPSPLAASDVLGTGWYGAAPPRSSCTPEPTRAAPPDGGAAAPRTSRSPNRILH